jgi:hypothetical protein
MNAFHTNWTQPFFVRNPGRAYSLPDYELLTTVLSALEWRRYNGSIKMITDAAGADYYRSLGIAHIWDRGIDNSLDRLIDGAVSPLPFWAAGKLFALQAEAAPCVMLDTDFIVWEPIAGELSGAVLAVIHREELSNGCYPDKSFFDMSGGYEFPLEWDWQALPCNTAFLYIADGSFKTGYTAESIRFMRHVRHARDIIVEMVFAEQRLLAMCAGARNIPITALLDMRRLEEQDRFTHVWGLKSELNARPDTRRHFCASCARRILRDFPQEAARLRRISCLETYFETGSKAESIRKEEP